MTLITHYINSSRSLAMRHLLSLALCAPVAAFAQQMTLDQCIEHAIQNNLNLQQRAIDIRMRDVQLNTSRNSWLPEVKAQVGEQLSFGNYNSTTGSMDASQSPVNRDLAFTTASVDASINLFDGFKVKNSIRADRFSLDAATADLEQARKDIGIQVATQYLQCLYYKGIADVARSQVQVSTQLLNRARILVEEGKRPLSEQKELEAILASDQYSLAEAEGNSSLALLTLAQLLNLPSPQNFDVCEVQASTTPVMQADAIYQQAQESWPAIRAAKAQIEENKHRVELARSDYYPTLTLQGSIRTFYVNMFHQNPGFSGFGDQLFRDNRNEVVGLHLSVPVFNRFQTRNNIRKAKISLESRQVALDELRQNLRKQIQTATTNAVVAQNKQTAALKAAEAAEVSLTYEQERYDAGRSSTFDLQQARQKCIKAQQDAIQAKYEYFIRQRILQFYQQN